MFKLKLYKDGKEHTNFILDGELAKKSKSNLNGIDDCIEKIVAGGRFTFPLEIAFLKDAERSVFNPETGQHQKRFPGGKSIPLTGLSIYGETVCYEHVRHNSMNAQILEYTPTMKQFSKRSDREVVEVIHDAALAWFLCFASPHVENNACPKEGRRTPMLRIVNSQKDAIDIIRTEKLANKLKALLLVDEESTKDEQLKLAEIAQSIGIQNVNALVERSGIAALSARVLTVIGDINIGPGPKQIENCDKVRKYYSMFSKDTPEMAAKRAIQQARDDHKISLTTEGGVHRWWFNNEDGVKSEEMLGGIPSTHNATTALVDYFLKAKTKEEKELVVKIATAINYTKS